MIEQKLTDGYGFGMKIDGINGMDCKVFFTSVFTQIIDLYKKNENNLHETLNMSYMTFWAKCLVFNGFR